MPLPAADFLVSPRGFINFTKVWLSSINTILGFPKLLSVKIIVECEERHAFKRR